MLLFQLWRPFLPGHDLSTLYGDDPDDADNFPILDPSQNEKMDVNEISVYAHFIKIGDIDTKNQRFYSSIISYSP